ncbi:hypothetical protein ACWC4C_06070 [Streptomyces olivaceoviridis]|nr:hypothetical protein SHJG_1545 [Streptomyces hygroscopicus subsp. jinggangensis 5008]AGF61042.1 hypothetical protein SHJGH_1376 [Streptomyces hygroscopicus subsp. jinggangensis TL01]ALP00163.1 hypothetical protein SHL15_9247 [Streptomyces hygroscopicus subsp. limoneus]
MFRSRLAAAAAVTTMAAGAVVGIAPLAMAAPDAAVSACVADLQSAQTSNNAAIAADQANNPAAARTHNVSTATYLVAAIGDCQGQPQVVGTNVLAATATNATALVYNLLGASSAALGSEQATASAITQALANAS